METIRVAELFAGVGGFRLGLEGYRDEKRPEFDMPAAGPYETVWANQWEPPGTDGKQFAARCYAERFGEEGFVNDDINKVLDAYEAGDVEIPDVDMLVGGFPCQDYSVAKPLAAAAGIEGKKGVLWWDIYRFLHLKEPRYVLLENVDRLLKSPASCRGRDFAIMLACLADAGYSVEWHVVNSAAYGFPQRRKRVYVFAELTSRSWDLAERAVDGVLARALPIVPPEFDDFSRFEIQRDPYDITERFELAGKRSPFGTGGVMRDFQVLTWELEEAPRPEAGKTLGDVLVPADEVPDAYWLPEEKAGQWRYLKGSKSEERVDKKTGYAYRYSEGAMAFPDPLDRPSRTILTGEGGAGASRFKHVVEQDGRLRRLVPEELEALQGFPTGWTEGMSDSRRAFCMGNALVVGIPHLIGAELARRLDETAL